MSLSDCPCWSIPLIQIYVTLSKMSLFPMYNHYQTHIRHVCVSVGDMCWASRWNMKYCGCGGIIYVPPISFFIGLKVTTVWIFCLTAFRGQGHVCIRRWIMTLITMLACWGETCEEEKWAENGEGPSSVYSTRETMRGEAYVENENRDK